MQISLFYLNFPQNEMKDKKIYYFLILSIGLWNLLIILPPFIKSFLPDISNLIYSSFHHICHQYESRSIFINNEKLAVCARCSGIYMGFFVGLLLLKYFKVTIEKFLLFFLIASLPLMIDVSFNFLSIYTSNITTRTISGLIFGILSSIVLYKTISEAFKEIIFKLKRRISCTKNQTNSFHHFMEE